MSLLVRDRSRAWRVRRQSEVLDEHIGPLHKPNTLIEWGSVTKTVTAALARQLEQRGILHLTDAVRDHLPEAGLSPEITVAHLIDHTSGLPPVPADLTWARNPYAKYTNDYFDHHVLPRLACTKTGSFAYSNLGYAVLTRLVERSTKRTWWELARDYVLDPLGVTDVSTIHDPTRIIQLRSWSGSVRTTWVDTGPFVGAGGLLSTFDALEAYAIACGQAWPDEMPEWQRGPSMFWHAGHNRDQGAFACVAPDDGYSIVIHTAGYRVGTADRLSFRLERQHPRAGRPRATGQ